MIKPTDFTKCLPFLYSHQTYTQFQCQQTKECISYTKLCNGYDDCSDKSDESDELCVGTFCPEGSFRCGYGACIAESAACDHSVDCRDGSDELDLICKNKYSMSSAKKWVISKGHIEQPDIVTPQSTRKSCTITKNNTALQYRTIFSGLELINGSTVDDQTTIILRCHPNYVLQGNEFNICVDGSWKKEFPKCIKICESKNFAYDPKLLSTCKYGGDVVDCKTTPLIEGSLAGSVCAPGYKNKTSIIKSEKTCGADGNWAIPHKLECIPDCGKVFNTVEEFPWVVSIYQHTNDFNFEYRCLGAIIEPFHVVTVSSCFSQGLETRNVLVVLGNHTIGFNTEKEHGFDYVRIANITVEIL